MKTDEEIKKTAKELTKDRGLDCYNAALVGIYEAHYSFAISKINGKDKIISELKEEIRVLNEEIKTLNSYGNDE